MSNPFEKYFQATERQQSKLDKVLSTPSASLFQGYEPPNYNTPSEKSVGDYLGDTATDAAKALLTAQGVAVSAVDLGLYSLGGLGSLAQTIGHTVAPDTIPEVVVPEFGVGSKALNDTFGVNIADAKQYWGNQFYSDARKKQEAELQAGYTDSQMTDWKKSWEDSYATQLIGLQKSGATEQQLKDFNDGFNKQYQEAAKQFIASKQTSWDKSLGENASIVGDAFGYVADNPSLGVGAAIDSLGYLLPSLAVSKGVLALQNAAKAASEGGKAIAAGVGEGSVSSLAIAEQMRNNSDTGTIGGGKLLAAAAAGTLTGLIGGASNKLGARFGSADVDTAGLAALGTSAATRLPALTRPIAATGQEAGEEFLQGFGETITPNIAEGKDPLTGLSQELALGTFAGGIMGAGMNAPSLVSGGFSDISSGLGKIKDAASLKSFETLSNPEHKNYNPAQAFNIQLKNLESNDETVRTQAEASVSKIETDLDTARASVEKRIKSIQTTLKAMPPSDQTTDAQNLEIEALGKEYSELTTKSSTLADQYVAFLDAQVTAQEHRDVKQGTQFTEEQAKADIATLTQPQTSTATWTYLGFNTPVEVRGEPYTDDNGEVYLPVKYELNGEMVDASVPANEVTSQPNPTDTTAQQEALDRVTRHFSKYSNDDLDLLATSPVFNEQQRNSLRVLSKSKRELAAVQDPSQVFDNILNGYQGKTIQESHRGLNQYTDMVNTAVATKNEQLASLALDGLGAFTQDHIAKRDAINEAFGLVQKGTYKEIRVVRTEDGTWGFVPFTAQEVRAGKNADGVVFLEDDALKEELNSVGGFNVHRNSDTPTKGRTIGAITQINNETQLIQDRFNALSGVAESFVGVTPKPVDTSTAPTVDAPIVTQPSDTTAPVDNPVPEAPVQSDVPTKTTVEDVPTSKDEASKALGRLKTTFAIMDTPTVDEVTPEQIKQWKHNNNSTSVSIGGRSRTQGGIDAINADIAKVESYLATKGTMSPEGIVYDKEYSAKDIIALLPDDKNSKHTKYLREVITKLIAQVPDVTFILAKTDFKEDADKVNAYFSPEINQISVWYNARQPLESFTHELQHAATMFGVRELELPEHAGIKKTVEDLMQVTRKAFSDRLAAGNTVSAGMIEYSLTKLDEFIAVGTTDREVIKFLKTIKLSPKRSVFSSLVSSLGKLFGMTTSEVNAYDAVLAITAKAYTLNAARKIADDKFIANVRALEKEAQDAATAKAEEKAKIDGEMLTVKPEKVSKLDSYLFDDGMVAAAEDMANRFNNDPALTEVKVTKYFDSIQVMDLQDAGLVNAQESMSREQWQAYEAERLKRLEATTPSQNTPVVVQDAKQAPVETAKVVPSVNVWAGSNENAGLSNLATRPFIFGTKKYQSVEHAYQTLKSGSFDQQTYDKYAGTENKKIAGNRGTKTTDNANVRLMEKLMTASFEQNKDAMELLQKTGDAAITHTQDKSIWGKEFPRILMEIRESNKAATPSQDTPDVTEGDKQASVETKVESEAKTADTTPPVSGKAKDVVAELKQSHSGLLSAETKATLDTLLDLSINLFPDTLVQFIKDVSQIPARLKVTKFTFGKTVFDPDNARQANVFINPEGKVGKDGNVLSDLYRTVVHEFIHAATVGYLNTNFEGTQYKTLLSLVGAAGEYLERQPTDSQDKTVLALRNVLKNGNPVAQAQELLAYGLTHKSVIEWAKATPYSWSTETHKGISDTSQTLLNGNTPKTVYDALLAVYGNIIQIEERNNVKTTDTGTRDDNGTTEGGVGGASDTNDTSVKEQSAKSDGGTGTGNVEVEQTSTESQVEPSTEAKTIYEKLGSKTATGNVQIKYVLQAAGVAFANSLGGVFSLRVNGVKHHFGNPFSSIPKLLAADPSLTATKSTQESVERYIDWVLNSNEERAKWIRSKLQSGALKGKPIIYYAELGEPSHANALDYLINTYMWEEQKTAPEVTPLKSDFKGKVILAHAGTGKSFATKSNPDLIDGDVLYYEATNTIVDKYNKQNGETVPNIKDVTGTRGVFEAWGEYGDKAATKALASIKAVYGFEDIESLADVTSKEVKQWKAVTNDKKLNRPQSDIDAINGYIAEIESYLSNKTEIDSRKAEAIRRRKEIYQEYADQAKALAKAGKTVLSSSIREELIAVADMVVIQDDAAFIGKNLTSAERVNQNSETDLVKIREKIQKAVKVAGKLNEEGVPIVAYKLGKGEYISDLIFENEAVATEDAKVTVLQDVTDEGAAAERKKPFNLRNILKGYFTQSITKEDGVGANPLVTVKDFLSNFDVRTQVSKWLNDRRKPTLKQLEQVEHFKKFHAEFAKALKFVFNTQASAIFVSNKENLVGYLEMGKKPSTRELDENVVTALALSAYSYLIKQGNKVMNTNEELETLFRLKKGVRAPLEIEQMFRFAGQEMPIVVKALGTDTAKALGLRVREDQDPTLQDRLNTSLGILAMEAMAKAGFIVIDTLEGKPLTDFLTAIKTVRESKAHTSEDEYDFEVDTDAETEISKFTMVRPNALMEGESKTVFDGNRPVLTEGLPTLNSSLVNELIEANKDTKGFLSYLFGVDVGLTTPLKEIPKKFSQRLINGTDASVPSVQAELLTEAQKHSFTMRTNTVAVFAAMQKLGENSQFLKEVLGIWIDDHVLSRTHVTERDSLQAKAQNDWTAVLNGLEWADATLDENGQYQEFYDTQFVAQNQRQHLNSNMFSAQSSQIHRAMAALTGFSTTIDLTKDEQGTVKDEALLNLFYQAVGEGLEGLDDYLKADILAKAEAGLHQFFTVDKVYGDYYVPALKAFLETTESKSAIGAMRALIETGTIDTTQQKAIAAFVDKGGMGAQSLQSLIALAELDIAQPSGTFTTTIGFGSDGVNHGVSAANMLTGVISKDMRQQTGIFPIAEKGQVQISNMQEVYKRKITDYYVDFGKVMSAKLRDLVDTLVGKIDTDFVQGMTALFPKFEVLDDTGELRDLLAMRKIAKIWAIPFNYSAGKAALQRALARGFLAGIYGNMNKLANEALDIIDAGRKEGVTEEEKAALRLKLKTVKLKTTTLQDNLNKVLDKYGMSVTLPEPQLLNEEDKGKLSTELENTLMQAAIDLHGEAAWQATEEFAKDYLEVRNVYTEVEKASFALFDVVRNQLIEEKKASRKYTNVNAKVQVKGKTVQYTAEELNAQEAEYFGLTTVEMAEIDAVLAAMRPMFNTALSIGSESTNAADSVTNPSGVSVRKHKMQREPAKGLRAVNTFYLKERDANRKPFSESRNIGLTKEVEENAGVASSANAVQSIDAFVAAKVQAFMDALNVHDNAVFGLKDFLKGVKKQNEEHLKALTNYQLGLEHAKMLVKVYVGYKAFMATQEEALKSEDVMVKENAQKLITEANKQMGVLLKGEQMFKRGKPLQDKYGNPIFKGGLIPKLQAANLPINGNAKIAEAISVFINFALAHDLQKLEVLLDTYSIHQFAGEGGMHQLTDDNRASINEQKALVKKAKADLQAQLKDKTAPMNTTEAVKPTTKLAEFLRKAKGAVIDITSLIEHLTNNTDINDLKARAAQLEVLKAITPLIDKATKVIYSEGDYDGYGYYDEETNTLHINSAKEAEGGVRSTLAVHELLHAALSRRIKTLNISIETKEAEAKKTGKEVSFTSAEVALRNLEKLRVNLVTPDGMRMLELQAELGSAIEDSVQFYKETEALYESQKAENASTIKELQALNKEEARRVEIEGEIKKRGTGIGAAYKAQLEAELQTLAPKAELDIKRNALLSKQQELRNTKALLDKANKYFELRETLSKKVLSERTRKDGSSSKFTQLNLVEMLTNIDEFISYGLTESRLQEAMKGTQVDRGGRTFSAKLRKFVEFVGQVLGFRTHQISALAAFASDTADLLSAIGSVTPVVAPNKGERLFSTQSAEDRVNTKPEINTALEQARKAVRELLTQLNFKFVDSPDVNLSDIERIASKYLTEGESNNDPAFLKDAAISLSYAIYFELGLPQGNAKMREWLEQSLLDWLTTGEIPKLHKSVWVKVVEIFNKIMAAFSGKEFKAIESRLEATLNKIINREDFSFKPKQGYAKLVFQKEMTNNPLAVQSLLTFIKSGIKFALTGSVAYADQVPLYRQENKPLHDMDFLVAPEDLQDAYDYFTQKDPDNWGGSFTLYDVVKEGKRILGFAIVPKGFVIKNGKSEWNREQKAPERSYDVFNVVTGLKAGSYYFLGGKEEVFTGVAGITIDLLAEDARDTVTQTFKDTTGTNKSIEVSSYVGGFTAKLDMLRLKDITDFIGVVPPTERVLSKPKAVKPTEEPITKPAPAVNTIAQYQAEAAALEDDALDVALSGLLDKQRKGDKSPLLKMKFKAYNDEMNKRGAAVSNKGERRYSKNTLSGNGLTVASTRQILVKQFGEKLIKALEAKGLLRIVETMAETPEAALESNTEGYYLNGKATLVADGLTPETVVATLLHELSGHKGFQELMEPAAYNALMKQFDKLVAEGNPIALAALKRAQQATGSDGKPLSLQGQMDEYLPYLLTIQAAINATQAQKSAIAKFIDNVFRAVRAWAYKKLQANGYEGAASTFMQPQDIVFMAERMLREIANSSVTSGNPQSSIKFSTQSAEDLVNGQSSLDIMQALPHSNTGAFNQQLDRLITEEIGQLYNQDDAAKARIDEIQTFTASDALNAGFTLSRKEQYVQQALQYAVAAYMKLHAGGANVGQLRRVYHAAKAKMDVTGKDFHEGDWATATQQERDIAKAKYDFMFDSSQDSEFMSRFVSMALASESVSKILDIALPLTKPETQDKTWFETVNDWVSYVMAWLTNKYVRLNPIAGASNQLVQLMDNLVKLDIRARQEGVSFHQKAWNSIGLVTTPLNKALKGAGGAVLSGVGLRESRFLPVRALGAILVLRSEEAAKAIPKMIIDMRNNQLPNTKLGEVANILLEASGVGTLRDKFDVLIRQTNLNAKNRQDIVDGVKKAVNKWFKEPLTKVQSKAIAYGLLGTDAQALLENYSVEDIVGMALHEGKLNAEIAKLKSEIAKNPNGNDMLNAAEQLGYYMVTRIGGEGLVKNALGISIGLGTQYFTSVEQADPKLVGQLNTLVSMLAMTHVPNSDKAILAALYKTDAEGIHATIQLHQGLVNDSLKDFQANPLNMVKGWMPEVTNPYLEIKAANSMVERQQMEAEGWVLIDELKRDKHDKGSPKYLMKHNDIGYQRLVSGAVDLGSTARSGTEAINRTSPKYLGITQARYQNAARRAAIPNGSFDPSKQPRGLIAAYDTDGVALGFNYEMDNETRDAHLDRKHNIGDLLGTFGGLNYYKPEKAKQSNTVAEVLFEDYKANYSQNPNAYLKISHKSTDPKVVEMWRMLPQDFKQRATELYGKGNPIIIRNEAFNLAFGFKKFSVVSYAFDAVKAERERIAKGLVGTGKSPNAFQSGFVRLAEATRKGTAQADFAKAEHVTQEIVKAIKDFIVIRSGTTMMWNIFANVLMLMANGINPVTIIKDWVFAVTNVRAYQKLNSQLIQAQADLAGGKDPIALKQKIGALKAELKANVMNPYINAGLLSSIVEDVNIQQGEYTYTSAFKQTVDAKTQWIPKPVKTAAAIATIAPSTKLYQFLATTTQLSDFVAKYSMSKHLQANGTDIDASIIEASKTFINYDLPTSQGLQYANDMGLFMFTKFFLRIQAVLMKLLGKRAGSVIAQHILVESMTGAEGILSPSLFNHIGNNPLESSVLGIPSAFFGIGTIDAVTDVGAPF